MYLSNDRGYAPVMIDKPAIGQEYEELVGGHVADIDVSITRMLRKKYEGLNVIGVFNVSLLAFASLGHATATLDTSHENIVRRRGWFPPYNRDAEGALGDINIFAKYNYRWGSEDFILYSIRIGLIMLQYLIKEPGPNETTTSHCGKTDALIETAGKALRGDPAKYIYVYDRYWTRSTALYEEVKKASWDKVIMKEQQKRALAEVSNGFFDSKEQYEKYGVPWKRGLIFYGPPGNGKTISIKALMHDLMERNPAVPTLYVKSAPNTWDISSIFNLARGMSPCMLIMEDIETIVTPRTRSYFFNEVDGLGNNNGILMVASTNYLDRLDPGIGKRPSRFDRKYLFALPDQHERTLYAQYWRHKVLKRSNDIDFPERICSAVADITDAFSFAFMQEAFIATLLAMARDDLDKSIHTTSTSSSDPTREQISPQHIENGSELSEKYFDIEDDSNDREHPELNKYRLWRVFKDQANALREELLEGPDRADGDVMGELMERSERLTMRGASNANGPYRDAHKSDAQHTAAFDDPRISEGGPRAFTNGDHLASADPSAQLAATSIGQYPMSSTLERFESAFMEWVSNK